MSVLYFNMPHYERGFSPAPQRAWESDGEHAFVCQAGRAELRVFRFGEGKPWWAQCDNPEFEAVAWFWTPEQAQHWAEEQLQGWAA